MPHKPQPILCERMSACADAARYAHTALENMPLWNERDISHSSAERVIIGDAFTLADTWCKRCSSSSAALLWNVKRMEEKHRHHARAHFSQRLAHRADRQG